jgi:TatD DNase family protein
MNFVEPRLSFIDSHAHIDDEQFDADRTEVVTRATAVGVNHIINIGYEPAKWESSIELGRRFPSVSFTLGLHPSESDLYSPDLIMRLGELLQTSGAVAVGEIGIDLFRNGPSLELQRASFEAQLALANELGIPVVIHQRAASDEVMEVLARAPVSLRCVLHSFDGTHALRDLGLKRGYMFGIGGLMTRPTSEGLRKVLKKVPLNRMILETDSPYLVPAGVEGRRNEPATIPTIATALAELLGLPLRAVADTTSRNAIEMFRLHSSAGVGATIA